MPLTIVLRSPFFPLGRHFIAYIQRALLDFSSYDRTAHGDAENLFNSHAKEWIGCHLDIPFVFRVEWLNVSGLKVEMFKPFGMASLLSAGSSNFHKL